MKKWFWRLGAVLALTTVFFSAGMFQGETVKAEEEVIYHCLCCRTDDTHVGDCDGTPLAWYPWDGTNIAGLDMTKNWYLTKNVAGFVLTSASKV